MRKPAPPTAQIPDELDGPLFRIRSLVTTETIDRSTGEFGTPRLLPETHYTVVKRGGTIDLMTTQPAALDIDLLIRRVLQHLLREMDFWNLTRKEKSDPSKSEP